MSGYDVFGVIAGVLGIIGLFPMIMSCIRGQLPPARLKELDQTLSDTSALFRTVTEEGLLTNTIFVAQTERGLSEMYLRAGDLRAKIHNATTVIKNVKAFMDGLSYKISLLCAEVKELRAVISTTSAEERERLLGRNHQTLPHPSDTACHNHMASLPSVHPADSQNRSRTSEFGRSTPSLACPPSAVIKYCRFQSHSISRYSGDLLEHPHHVFCSPSTSRMPYEHMQTSRESRRHWMGLENLSSSDTRPASSECRFSPVDSNTTTRVSPSFPIRLRVNMSLNTHFIFLRDRRYHKSRLRLTSTTRSLLRVVRIAQHPTKVLPHRLVAGGRLVVQLNRMDIRRLNHAVGEGKMMLIHSASSRTGSNG